MSFDKYKFFKSIGKLGGTARAKSLTAKRRKEIAAMGAKARESKRKAEAA